MVCSNTFYSPLPCPVTPVTLELPPVEPQTMLNGP